MIAPFALPERAEVITDKVVPQGYGRRGSPGIEIEIEGAPDFAPFYLHYAFDAAGRVRQISYSSKHESADLRALLSFTCDVASRLLQVGWTVASLIAVGPDHYMAAILACAADAERKAMAATPNTEGV